MSDPKVVLQAHSLRSAAAGRAVLHGTRAPRTRRALLGALYGSAVLAVIIVVVVLVANKIINLIH